MIEVNFLELVLSIVIGGLVGGWFSDKISRTNTIVREHNHLFQLVLNTRKKSLGTLNCDYYRNNGFRNGYMEIVGITKEDIKNSLKTITFQLNHQDIKNPFVYTNIQPLFDYIDAFNEYNSGAPLPPEYSIYGDEIHYLKAHTYISKSYLCKKFIDIKYENFSKFMRTGFYDVDFEELISLFSEKTEVNKEIQEKLRRCENIVSEMKKTKNKISWRDVLLNRDIKIFYVIMIPFIILFQILLFNLGLSCI